MIVLDTNVVSEAMRPEPDETVVAWLDGLVPTEVATTAVTAAELLYGAARLQRGRRRTRLTAAIHRLLDGNFQGRVEPFDVAAATHYATVVADREQAGGPVGVADAQIASICRARRATLATRNTRDFEGTGIELFDPWHGR